MPFEDKKHTQSVLDGAKYQRGDNWVSDQIMALITCSAQNNPFHEHPLKQYDITRHANTLLCLDLGNNGLRMNKARIFENACDAIIKIFF